MTEMQTKDTQITSFAKPASVCRYTEHTERMKAVPVFPEGELGKVAVEVHEKIYKIK